jgi:hypothetical protein
MPRCAFGVSEFFHRAAIQDLSARRLIKGMPRFLRLMSNSDFHYLDTAKESGPASAIPQSFASASAGMRKCLPTFTSRK